jgi:photosystem II stability/assembly factor-like uncharacterized protein
MNLHRSFAFLSLVVCSALLGAGCLPGPSAPKGPDGGVFKSSDRGQTWSQKRVLIEGPKGVSFGSSIITAFVFDPQDPNNIYVGTTDRGLLYTRDGGESWQITKGLSKGRIEAIAVDTKDKCTVYASAGNRIFKTTNCGLDWIQTWFDPKTTKTFTHLLVDWFNPTVLYAGTSEGDVLKSSDSGVSFQVVKRAAAPVSSIAIHPRDSRVLYVATRGEGIWKTMDGGQTWLPIIKQLSAFDPQHRPWQVLFDPMDPNTMYTVLRFGILLSKDGGETWKALTLVNPPNAVEVRMMAVHPKNSKEIQYITPSTLVLSNDGGVTWSAKRLPSTRLPNILVTDPQNGHVLYLGMGGEAK